MTNVRLTLMAADEWLYCPYCGKRLELDQEPDAIIRSADGIDVETSQEAGFSFADSLSHCGFHIRLWVAEDEYAEAVE